MVPSDDPRFAGLNPAVHEPRVVIRNNGLESLQAISIMYGTDGFKQRMFAWNGHIGSGLTAEVKLTHLIDMRPGANTFTVKLGDPNGRKDKNPLDNVKSTAFTAADLLGTRFTLRLRTAAGNGGWLHLESTRGRVLMRLSDTEETWFEQEIQPGGFFGSDGEKLAEGGSQIAQRDNGTTLA